MIGVTSEIAFAADASPSATPNRGLAAPSPTGVPPVSPMPAAPQPVAPVPAAVDLTAPPPAAENQAITSKWWFWTAIGAAVVGGVVAIYLVERAPAPPGCPTAMGYLCPR